MDVSKLPLLFIKELNKYNRGKKPMVYISGGETTVKIRGNGKGGRNQEFALHFMKLMKKEMPEQKYFLLSAGTDGRDGPTNAAGAIVNHNSLTQIRSQNINLDKELMNNNSYEVLKKINSLVIIDGTNTNVADIQLLYLI
jgi:hydroxypyruvate reductase